MRGHWGCYMSEVMAIPFGNFTDKILVLQCTSNVLIYISSLVLNDHIWGRLWLKPSHIYALPLDAINCYNVNGLNDVTGEIAIREISILIKPLLHQWLFDLAMYYQQIVLKVWIAAYYKGIMDY